MKVSAPEYPQFLASLKATIRQRQYQALRAVNHELLALYLEIGEAIYRKQEELGWGKAVVETLARDLQTEFPGRNGFSARNLWNMRDLYFSYRDLQKLQPLVAEISSAKNLVILAPCNDLLLPKLDSKYQLTPARKIIAERIKTQKMILLSMILSNKRVGLADHQRTTHPKSTGMNYLSRKKSSEILMSKAVD